MTNPSADDARPADAGRASAPGHAPQAGETPPSQAALPETPRNPEPSRAENTAETAALEAELAAARAETALAEAETAAAEAAATFAHAPAADSSNADSSNGDQPLLRLVDVEKHFGPVRALMGIDLDIPVGQVTALVGDNGAGKSTLIKCIAGIWQPEHGEILWQGRPVRFHSPKDATDLGIATVYQDLALCDNLDIVQNMFLGQEEVKAWTLDEVSMETTAKRTLADLRVVTIQSVRQPVGSLSGGQRQAVAVAKAVMRQAKMVIMDEPTAALGVTQTRVVLDLIHQLKDQGIAVIVISHNLNDVMAVADRVAVLRLGRLVAVGPLAQYDAQSIVDLMTTGTSARVAAAPAKPSSGSSSEH